MPISNNLKLPRAISKSLLFALLATLLLSALASVSAKPIHKENRPTHRHLERRQLPISTDGSCGPTAGTQCASGYCCSSGGFCGTGSAWCGTGCQPAYGTCNSGSSNSTTKTKTTTIKKTSTTVAGAPKTTTPASQPTTAVVVIKSSTTTLVAAPAQPTTTIAASNPTSTAAAPKPATTNIASSGNCPTYPESTDGTCGSNAKACPAPYCCSATGYCGLGDAWCGTGCQVGFGVCNSGTCSGSGSNSSSGSTTAALPAQTTQVSAPATTVVPAASTTAGSPAKTTTTKAPATTTAAAPVTTISVDPSLVPRFTQQTEVGTYFTQWGVYSRNFKVKNILSMSGASELTFINYAFGNVYPKNGGYECDIINKLESGAGDGGDAWADFGMGYTTSDSVDGVEDKWDSPLAGNFNQLKKLKKIYPKLRVLISLGGWTWSKYFSKAATTDALRKQLVSSCINVYIKGNLPVIDGRGGAGAAANIFDGIDIDWEYPGGGGQSYNFYSSADKTNFNLLLAEFRSQLSALSMTTAKPYGLTIAAGSGRDKIMVTEPSVYSQYLDWINVMSYDYHGAWDATGPTNFHSNLYGDPNTPDYNSPTTGILPGANRYYNIKDSVEYLIASGAPASKIMVGLPFYGRGWTGVKPGPAGTNGVYQNATGAAAGTYEAGYEDYRVLKNAAGTVYLHSPTQQSYKYDLQSGTWWSYDTPADIDRKVAFAKTNGLRGVFSWSLDGDSDNGELLSRCVLVKA